jgi:hypothetical protein
MNGSWWDLCNGKSLGYFYSTLGYVPSEVCSEYAAICNPNNYYKKEPDASDLGCVAA